MMTEAERDLQRFEDILKEIGLIRESLKGLDKEAFLSSEDKKAAVAHHLTVSRGLSVAGSMNFRGRTHKNARLLWFCAG